MDLWKTIRVFKETTFVNCSLNAIMEKTFTVGQKTEFHKVIFLESLDQNQTVYIGTCPAAHCLC